MSIHRSVTSSMRMKRALERTRMVRAAEKRADYYQDKLEDQRDLVRDWATRSGLHMAERDAIERKADALARRVQVLTFTRWAWFLVGVIVGAACGIVAVVLQAAIRG